MINKDSVYVSYWLVAILSVLEAMLLPKCKGKIIYNKGCN